LPDIYTNGHLQQIVNTLYWRLRNILAAQYSYHSRSLTHGQGCPGACDAYIIKRHLAGRRLGRIHTESLIADAGSLASRQGSYAEHGNDDLTTQSSEEGIAFSLELVEYHYLAFLKLRFKHTELFKKNGAKVQNIYEFRILFPYFFCTFAAAIKNNIVITLNSL
jgi:hypothetical protein